MATSKSGMKRAKGEVGVLIFYFIFFSIFSIMFLYPVFWCVMNSLKTASEFFDAPMALPTEWRFENYLKVFTDFKYKEYTYFDMLFNSLWMTALKVFVNVLASVLLAYPIAKFRFPGKEFLYGLVVFSNTLPLFGTGTTMYKLTSALGMNNNPALMWLQWAGGFDFAFIVFYGTFKGIDNSYMESATIDGAGFFYTMFKIMMPQALPAIVGIAITQAVPAWNSYQTSMIYMRNYPNLAYGLYLFSKESNYIENSKAIYFCASIISLIPPIILYVCNQKRLLTNVTAGGLKG